MDVNRIDPAISTFLSTVNETYLDLLKRGFKAEDARAVLPNCTATHLIVTMNIRELVHFIEQRCCYKAQREICSIAWSMLSQCTPYAPYIFNNLGPKCYRLEMCPEKHPCGREPFKKFQRI